jgi:hypothetical protein
VAVVLLAVAVVLLAVVVVVSVVVLVVVPRSLLNPTDMLVSSLPVVRKIF